MNFFQCLSLFLVLSIEDYSAEHESGGNRSLENAMECRKSNIVGSLVQSSSAFLFPCTIEYSLICAVILFEIWKNIQFQNPQNHLPRLKEENLLLENNKKDRKCSFYNIGKDLQYTFKISLNYFKKKKLTKLVDEIK